MNTPELIRKKREGGNLEPAEMEFLISGYLDGSIEEYQISALLMAIFFKGMASEEAAALTKVMIRSGQQYDLSDLDGIATDKHSTGGVGDKVSLILAPWVASVGVINPMVSGRGLGHTGGTLDKLDAIPGYNWGITYEDLKKQLGTVGCGIIGQTGNFVPADKRLYALRDVTATVESIPLICASILSKKNASGAKALVMDVKTGSGAFMANEERSRALAEQLVSIGTSLGMRVSAIQTQMNQPLGKMIGNSLEILETLDLLENKGPADALDITRELAIEMVLLSGKASERGEAEKMLDASLTSGKAMEKFQEWISAQGGNPKIVDDRSLIEQIDTKIAFKADKSGIIQSMQTREIGVAGNMLGAGRQKTDDVVDLAVGLECHAKVGDKVESGQELFTIYHRDEKGLGECERLLKGAIVIGDQAVEKLPMIIDRIEAK